MADRHYSNIRDGCHNVCRNPYGTLLTIRPEYRVCPEMRDFHDFAAGWEDTEHYANCPVCRQFGGLIRINVDQETNRDVCGQVFYMLHHILRSES